MNQILFSCFGTTDPARGEHDGPMMHIMRHYHPQAVAVFITPEVAKLEKKDGRLKKLQEHTKHNWDGYNPEYHYYPTQVGDPSDLDALELPMLEAMQDFIWIYPNCEVLVNISSGTPQMQMLLSQMALDPRYHIRTVQVKNPEQSAGTSDRSNSKDYNVGEQLELAEMAENFPDAVNRCVEPQLFPLRRDMQWQQVQALLERRDYLAIQSMKGCLPEDLMQLVNHLAARSQLQDENARRYAREIKLPFDLYPIRKDVSTSGKEYREVSEYFLMMKNFQHAQRYSDFILRLNPFVIRLQIRAANLALQEEYGVAWKELLHEWEDRHSKDKHVKVSIDKLKEKVPNLHTHLEKSFRERNLRAPEDREPSIFLLNYILSGLKGVPDSVRKLFLSCEQLNRQLRNKVAHELKDLTDVVNPNQLEEDFLCLARGMQLLQLDYLGGHGSRGSGRVSLSRFRFESFPPGADISRLEAYFSEVAAYELFSV